MVALGDMPPEFGRSAHLDGVHCPSLLGGEPMGSAIVRPLASEDLSDLECRALSGAKHRRGCRELVVRGGVLQELQR